MSFFLAHISILAMWLWCWITFLGWGKLVFGAAGCRREDELSLAVSPWVGIAAVVAFLQLWHVAVPVNVAAFVAVSTIGVFAALLLGRRELALVVGTATRSPLLAMLLAGLVVWLANRSLNSQEYPDQGLYYLNAIRWNSDYSIVLGLGNLHDRLAFNNSNFLLHAMLEWGPWRSNTAHLVNGLFAALTIPLVLGGVHSIAFGRGAARQLAWFGLALGMLVAETAVDRHISSATPDFPATILVTIAAWRFLAVGLSADESRANLLRWNFLTIAMLAAAAVAIKTLVIFFVGLLCCAVLAACFWLRRREPLSTGAIARVMITGLVGAGIVVVPWIGRGYLLSGCPVFPSTIGRLNVDWAVTPEAAKTARDGIVVYARSAYWDRDASMVSGWSWVPGWFVHVILLRSPIEVVLPALISTVCAAGLLLRGRQRLHDAGPPAAGAFLASLIAAYVVSLVMWFLMAPSARMASFAFWGLAATMLGLFGRALGDELLDRHRRLILLGIVGMLLLPMVHESVLVETRYRKNPKLPEFGQHAYRFQPFVLPQGEALLPPPAGKLHTQQTRSGLTVYLSELQPDGKPGLLWDSPLPAARFFNADLTLRHADDMRGGFRVVSGRVDKAPE